MRDRAFVLTRATQGVLLTLALVTAAACATTAPRSAATEPCPGNVQLVVRNNTGYSIDVFRSEVGRAFVATVPPGTSHVPLRTRERGGGYLVYSTPGGAESARYLGHRSGTRYQIEERCMPES